MTVKENRPLDGVIREIGAAQSIALVCHVSPDGDTIGSALAVRQGLMQLGKRVALFCQDPVPEYLHFLPGAEEFRQPETVTDEEHFELLFCVDVSDDTRMGRCISLWNRFCRKYGVAALHSNMEELYRLLLNRDLEGARNWSNLYLEEAIHGSQQIYDA